MTDYEVLFRINNVNDALENMVLFLEQNLDFLVKRNLRRSKQNVIKNEEKDKVRIHGKYKNKCITIKVQRQS